MRKRGIGVEGKGKEVERKRKRGEQGKEGEDKRGREKEGKEERSWDLPIFLTSLRLWLS